MLEVVKNAKAHRFDRIKGALYGVACGDCLGAPVEFMDASQIRLQYGEVREILGGGWLGAYAGVGTDDTAMTLAVAEGIMNTGPVDDPVEKIGAEFIKWFYDAPIGAGAACARSIGYASKNGRVKTPKRSTWLKAAEKAHYDMAGRSGGNGSLMRTVPVALFTRASQACATLAADVSQMTHYDPDAAMACVIYSEIIRKLIRGYSLLPTLDRETSGTEYRRATRADVAFTPYPSGYVKDSFNTALWAASRERSFEDVLIATVNLGGDADTTGAIAGGIAGTAYGYSAIPDRWIKALDGKLKARLDAAAEAAGKVWGCGT